MLYDMIITESQHEDAIVMDIVVDWDIFEDEIFGDEHYIEIVSRTYLYASKEAMKNYRYEPEKSIIGIINDIS